jgi:hypothetical protein
MVEGTCVGGGRGKLIGSRDGKTDGSGLGNADNDTIGNVLGLVDGMVEGTCVGCGRIKLIIVNGNMRRVPAIPLAPGSVNGCIVKLFNPSTFCRH